MALSRPEQDDRAVAAGWRRLRYLPGRAKAFGIVLGTCTAAPAAMVVAATLGEPGTERRAAIHGALGSIGAAVTALIALALFEPPRSWSPRGYGAQLRARLLGLVAAVDSEAELHPREGKENDDEADVEGVESKP